jgi:urea carboxylase
MFDKVLIANRGVIACRIIRSLKTLGIRSVAVYSDADRDALHVSLADEALWIGPAAASQSYLNIDKILEAAQRSGAQAIHPGYGFLSENAEFHRRCQQQGLVFIGPTAEQIQAFGLKHQARALALAQQVPLLPGSGILQDQAQALAEAERLGYPVMLKSTAGGGGIGMQVVEHAEQLQQAYASVRALAQNHFQDAGLYLEKYVQHARHIEVQVFGDGQGQLWAFAERDCSLQRRNQKLIEETPAPHLQPEQRQYLAEMALRLLRPLNYRSAGTVEFVMDCDHQVFYFLEVNTRLQVEHGITEQLYGIDLVAWMILLASGDWQPPRQALQAVGHAIQLRIYAEDPRKNFQPSAGLLTHVAFTDQARIETAVETGSTVSAYYDPMIAKLIVTAPERQQALQLLQQGLAQTQLAGLETNLEYLQRIVASSVFQAGRQNTAFLPQFEWQCEKIEVLQAGIHTAVQDVLGRQGYWHVGVPPSGAMDQLSLHVANLILGNALNTAGLECTLHGPTLKFHCDSQIVLTGAKMSATLDQQPLAMWCSHVVQKGQVLHCGAIDAGCRSYIGIQGGLMVPAYLGSQATFSLGQFGGHAGRNLRVGDMLPIQQQSAGHSRALAAAQIPHFSAHWQIAVMYGPHGAPDFFSAQDIQQLFAEDFVVHHNSSRTGVRLLGSKPQWARSDGGEAGLHPSNIHDNAYAIGAIDFTGDMPIILGPDGPSLGGFVCPAVVVHSQLWKLGQLKAGDRVRLIPVSYAQAQQLEQQYQQMLSAEDLALVNYWPVFDAQMPCLQDAILARLPALQDRPEVTYRPAGNHYLLVEYGEMVLDLKLRFRIHALMQALEQLNMQGIIDLTPGIRSLQIHFQSLRLDQATLLAQLQQLEQSLPAVEQMQVASRIVYLPLAWEDGQSQLATAKYQQLVRADAPWCPDNVEFIRRINGLASKQAVKDVVYQASYLVMGLGDVYLGAPVATPLDPRHRLVTTKYNPARTWTAENAVGIGGAYLCVYGMEGPGGYQLVGRTTPMWRRYRQHPQFKAEQPWLLQIFDQIRFYEVSESELLQMRDAFNAGRLQLKIEQGQLHLGEYTAFLQDHSESIQAFKLMQQAHFEAERQRWQLAGVAEHLGDALEPLDDAEQIVLPEGAMALQSHIMGAVWTINCQVGDWVEAAATLALIEAMKMEIPIVAPQRMQVLAIAIVQGQTVKIGQVLFVLQADTTA